MRIHGHFHKLAKLYVSELLFSFIFCPPTFVFLQTIFFSYKAVLIMFGAISALLFIKIGLIMFGITSTLYSFIIYFCNQGPLLFTKSGAIRYIKIFLLFCAGLLILSFPVNIQRPSTNLLFILFDEEWPYRILRRSGRQYGKRHSRFHKESRLDGKAMGKLLLNGIDK